jgi:hypothetical protein
LAHHLARKQPEGLDGSINHSNWLQDSVILIFPLNSGNLKLSSLNAFLCAAFFSETQLCGIYRLKHLKRQPKAKQDLHQSGIQSHGKKEG